MMNPIEEGETPILSENWVTFVEKKVGGGVGTRAGNPLSGETTTVKLIFDHFLYFNDTYDPIVTCKDNSTTGSGA